MSSTQTPSAQGRLLALPEPGHTGILLPQPLAGGKREGMFTHLLGEEKLFVFPGKGNCPHSFAAKLWLAWYSSHSTERAWPSRGSPELELGVYILI